MSLYDTNIARSMIRTVPSAIYSFDHATGQLLTANSKAQMILFRIAADIRDQLLAAESESHALRYNVHVDLSEIATLMESSPNAFFLLPSQLNGAEYPGPDDVVDQIGQYFSDNTAGPAGQLAADQSVGQFVLDVAARTDRPGLDCAHYLSQKISSIKSLNGYLSVPPSFTNIESFENNLNQMVIFGMESVTVNGFNRFANRPINATHTVNIIYGSSLPIDTYVNHYDNDSIQKISSRLLFTEYYGCLRAAVQFAQRTNKPTKVYLTLLGAGVFNNDPVRIIYSLYQALYLIEYTYGTAANLIEPHILLYCKDPNKSTYQKIIRKVEAHFKKN